jgi:DNA-binding response OmpR family regulator
LIRSLDRMARIIVVEDSIAQRSALMELLEGDGHVMHGAATAAEAIGTLRSVPIDIVLLDLALPDARGTSALTRIRSAAPTARIVVVSACCDLEWRSFDFSQTRVALVALGADAYVPKPVDMKDLTAALVIPGGPRRASGVRPVLQLDPKARNAS